MNRGLRTIALAGGALAIVTATGCSAPTAPLPPRPPAVDVTMQDFRFDVKGAIPRGRVVFNVNNAGHRNHRLALVYLPDNLPPLDVQLRGTERASVDELASLPTRPPGARDRFAADLDPGRWAFICFLVEPDGTSHALQGMAREFRVQ